MGTEPSVPQWIVLVWFSQCAREQCQHLRLSPGGHSGHAQPVDSDIAVVPQTSWAEGVPVHHLVIPRDFSEDIYFGENARGRDTGKSLMKRVLRRMEVE